MLELPVAAPIVAEARALAERSGDVLTRFSIESNLVVASIDAGNLEKAEDLMARSSPLLGSGEMNFGRFNQANNRAELALARNDFLPAARAFREASRYLGPTTPSYAPALIAAGLGICALETGDLGEARRREQEMPDQSEDWHYDPSIILAFRIRLLDRRGRHREALELLDAAARDLDNRLVVAWLKVRALELQLRIKRKVHRGARKIALAAKLTAEALGLRHRADEFAAHLAELEAR
jgi:tetratricopeptide (TPR) repeat protein